MPFPSKSDRAIRQREVDVVLATGLLNRLIDRLTGVVHTAVSDFAFVIVRVEPEPSQWWMVKSSLTLQAIRFLAQRKRESGAMPEGIEVAKAVFLRSILRDAG